MKNLVKIGSLHDAPAVASDVANLIASSERMLADARNNRNSLETRFKCAYDAVLKVAIAMLRDHGYRPTTAAGHQQIAIQTLAHTLGCTTVEVRTLDGYRQLRHQEQYEGLDIVTAKHVEEATRDAVRLLEQAKAAVRKKTKSSVKREGRAPDDAT